MTGEEPRAVRMLSGVMALGIGHTGIHWSRRQQVRKDQTYE